MSDSDIQIIQVPIAGALAVAAGVLRYPAPFAGEIVNISATVNTAPTGAAAIFDVKKNGTTLFANAGDRPTVAVGAFAATPVVTKPGVAKTTVGGNQPNDTGVGYVSVLGPTVPSPTPVGTLAAGDYLTVDVAQVGSTVAGSNAVVSIAIKRK